MQAGGPWKECMQDCVLSCVSELTLWPYYVMWGDSLLEVWQEAVVLNVPEWTVQMWFLRKLIGLGQVTHHVCVCTHARVQVCEARCL